MPESTIRPRGRAPRAAALAAACLAALAAGSCATNNATMESSPKAAAFVSAKATDTARAAVQPALIRIHVVDTYADDGRVTKSESTGSGVIISAGGLAVTNHHVAGKAERLFVTLPSREEIPARLVGTDALTDIAVIQLEPPSPREFPFASWGRSADMRVGDPVLAMGSPLSLSQSVTLGIVSNTEMIMPTVWDSKMLLDGEDVGSIVRWLGHDATIFPGNSGGPLVNLRGEVIGINEISYGLGGAVPSDIASEVARLLIAHGAVPRAHLGAIFQPMLKGAGETGALVSSVIAGSPAAEAGLRPGDVLTALNGEPVVAAFEEDLPPLNLRVSQLAVGEPARLAVLRDGAALEVAATPVLRQPVYQPDTELRAFGITGRNLTVWTRLDLNRDSTDGVLVTSLGGGGPVSVSKPPLETNDVIVAVDQQPVRDLEELEKVSRKLVPNEGDRREVVLEFERRGKRLLTVANIGIDPLRDAAAETRRAWVPADTQVLTKELAKRLGIEGTKGVRVTQLYRDETGAEPPFQVGDLITHIDGDPIDASEPHDQDVFEETVRQYRVGAAAEFTVRRAGAELKVPYELPRKPASQREMRRHRDLDFEFTVREVAFLDRQSPEWRAGRDANVVVDQVTRGGWAALAKMNVGDKLLEIDGRPVMRVEDVREAMGAARAAKARFVLFKVQRGAYTMFIEVETAWGA